MAFYDVWPLEMNAGSQLETKQEMETFFLVKTKDVSYLQSGQNIKIYSVMVFCYDMILHSLKQHVQQVNKLKIYVWGAFHILHNHLTLHHVTIRYLDTSRRCRIRRRQRE